MKSFLSIVFVVAIAWTFAGCGPEKVKGSAPNVVGQWEWSSPAGGSWHLTISSDGSFRRHMTDSSKAKPTEIHGSWSMFEPKAKESSWLERHGFSRKPNAEDDLLRKLSNDADKRKFQVSAPGMLTLHYSTSAPAPSGAAGAASPSPGDSKTTPASQEVFIGETEVIHTVTNVDTGDVFLDLAGKTYKKAEDAVAATPETATPPPEPPAKGTPTPSTPSPLAVGTAATTTPAPASPAPSTPATPISSPKAAASITPIQATHGSAIATPAKPRHATPIQALPMKPGAS
jgi:hypothetical protein